MPIELSVAVQKKVPIPGIDFTSQYADAGMTIEIDDELLRDENGKLDPDRVRASYRRLYKMVEDAVNEQVKAFEYPLPSGAGGAG